MLLSIAYILLLGMFTGWICKKLKLPSLLGMILTGMILGPYVLNLIDNSILNHICLFDYLFISSQMSAKPYFIGSTGILLLW